MTARIGIIFVATLAGCIVVALVGFGIYAYKNRARPASTSTATPTPTPAQDIPLVPLHPPPSRPLGEGRIEVRTSLRVQSRRASIVDDGTDQAMWFEQAESEVRTTAATETWMDRHRRWRVGNGNDGEKRDAWDGTAQDGANEATTGIGIHDNPAVSEEVDGPEDTNIDHNGSALAAETAEAETNQQPVPVVRSAASAADLDQIIGAGDVSRNARGF